MDNIEEIIDADVREKAVEDMAAYKVGDVVWIIPEKRFGIVEDRSLAKDDAYKIVDNNSFYVKAIKCIKCTANSINVRMKDRFDNYHLTKIDCDFPALVESLNF